MQDHVGRCESVSKFVTSAPPPRRNVPGGQVASAAKRGPAGEQTRSISLPLSGEKWDATAVFLNTVNSGHYRILAQAVCSE